MSQIPNNQLPLGGRPRRTPESVANLIGGYVMAFVRVVFWLTLAFAMCGAAYVAVQCVLVICRIVLSAVGVDP
jgi:hypothetical protein